MEATPPSPAPAADSMPTQLAAMRTQEDTCYHCRDYVLQDTTNPMCDHAGDPFLDIAELTSHRDFRATMVNWAHKILDLAQCHRETAEYAVCYFDRYLRTWHGKPALFDRPTFQLAFVTCLYMAVKMHESAVFMPTDIFSKLSRNAYAPDEIQDMELIILKSIGWRLNPPTALTFVRQFLGLIPLADLPVTMRLTVYDLAKVQIELVLSNYRFVTVKKSVLAMTAVLNAFESLQYAPSFGHDLIQRADTMSDEEDEISHVRTELYRAIAKLPHSITESTNTGILADSTSCRDLEMTAARQASCDSPRSVYDASISARNAPAASNPTGMW